LFGHPLADWPLSGEFASTITPLQWVR